MGFDDRQHDRQAKAETAGLIEVPGAVAAHEGLEHRVALGLRDAGPLIEHADPDPPLGRLHLDFRPAAVLHGVVHQVGDRPLQLLRPPLHNDVPATPDAHRRAEIREIVADGLHHGGEIDEAEAAGIARLPIPHEG
jgi:hypothetical protein